MSYDGQNIKPMNISIKINLSVLAILFSFLTYGQEKVYWAAEVVDVSSEYGPLEYSALQALKKPNVLPGGGDSPQAWRPKKPNKKSFIVVSFKEAINARQVAIAESENPGAVSEVYAYDDRGREYKLFTVPTRDIPTESRLLNLFFEETTYKIRSIKVVIDGKASPGYNAIDAIAISNSNIPINVFINLAAGINQSVKIKRLGENVNSDYKEQGPILSPDGQYMYFSRQRHPDNVGGEDDLEDIWYSKWNEATQSWEEAKNVGEPLNTEGPNFISSITEVNGEEIIILGNRYGKNGKMYMGVSMSKREGNTFTKPVNLEIEDDHNYSDNTDFFLMPSGETMLMSAERLDTYGRRDLYVTFKKSDGTWTVPKNLGDDINTIGEDESPFYSEKEQVLYFSSDGYAGYGGADILVTRRLDDSWTKWTTPKNMGPGINKEGNDEYLSIPSSGKRIYYTHAGKEEDADIFTFKAEDAFVDPTTPYGLSASHLMDSIPENVIVIGEVLDDQTEQNIEAATVNLHRMEDGQANLEVTSNLNAQNNKFIFSPRKDFKYQIKVSAENYLPANEPLDLTIANLPDTIYKTIRLRAIPKKEIVTFNNILFEFDKSSLQAQSYPTLNRVVEYLKDNNVETIEIYGHTDAIGTNAYNLDLSKRRAFSVRNYLVDKGIAKTKISTTGFGETKPIATNETDLGRQKNRRVEFKFDDND